VIVEGGTPLSPRRPGGSSRRAARCSCGTPSANKWRRDLLLGTRSSPTADEGGRSFLDHKEEYVRDVLRSWRSARGTRRADLPGARKESGGRPLTEISNALSWEINGPLRAAVRLLSADAELALARPSGTPSWPTLPASSGSTRSTGRVRTLRPNYLAPSSPRRSHDGRVPGRFDGTLKRIGGSTFGRVREISCAGDDARAASGDKRRAVGLLSSGRRPCNTLVPWRSARASRRR